MKPTKTQKEILFEVLRRYTRFNSGESLCNAWVCLGSKTEFKSVNKKYLVPIDNGIKHAIVWWKLTLKGSKIIQSWLDQGYTHIDIEKGNYPV